MKHSLIITAAGTGSRMNLGYNKMLYEYDGDIVINHTINKFIKFAIFDQIIITINKEDLGIMQEKVIKDDRVKIVIGGETRQDSVYQGLLKVENEYVLVHDGARPFISGELINKIIEELKEKQDCYVVGVNSKDSIRLVENEKVTKNLPRENLYLMQTPQIAKTKILKQVHELAQKDNYIDNDESGLLNKYGFEINLIIGEYSNKKITTKEDLEG